MLKKLWTNYVNLIYGIPWTLRLFQKKYPNSKIIASGATKGRIFKNETDVTFGLGWVFSRGGTLILTEETLVYSEWINPIKWIIPLNNIQKAILLKIRGVFSFSKGLVLVINTKDNKHYQFGLYYHPIWENQQVLQYELGTQKKKYSWFIIFQIILLLITIVYSIVFWLEH
jgi:hypothetical protein